MKVGERWVEKGQIGDEVGDELIALFLDLENLVFDLWQAGDWKAAISVLTSAVSALKTRGTLVARVAVCDRSLATALAFALGGLGIRVFRHDGGPEAADRALVERLQRKCPRAALPL